jgi:hypothetical protein
MICTVHQTSGGWGFTITKTRLMGRAERAASTGENRISYAVLVGKSEGHIHIKTGGGGNLENPGVNRRTILKLILCGDGFMDFIHHTKSKILKILKN